MKEILDAELLRRLKAGDSNAFDKIFKKYYNLLCHEAQGYFKSDYLIEEIVCDIFTKIWQKGKHLKITSSLRDYLVKAVHNNCINYYRMQKVQDKLKQEVEEINKKAYSLSDIGQNPLEYTITKELQENLTHAIESLPTRYKQAFKLSRFNDLTYEEIANEMGISVNGVKMNIKKALEHLRKKMAEYLITVLFIAIDSILFFY